MSARDIAGRRFGRLTALRFVENRRVGSQSKRVWLLRCDCGVEVTLPYGAFSTGNTASCGCLLREAITKHGGSGTQLYSIWHSMIQRCRNSNDRGWHLYGGRGIRVCERWADFAAFRADMAPRPVGTSLDRINVDGDYEPANCRWATPRGQANNRRNNLRFTLNGETLTAAQWARRAGLSTTGFLSRMASGWSLERAIATPSDPRNQPARRPGSRRCRWLSFGGRTLTVAQWADELGIKPVTLYGRLTAGWSIEDALTRAVAVKRNG